MAKNKTGAPPNAQTCNPVERCKVESIISVDERGQMVLPKDLREKAGVKAGDKFVVTSWVKDGEVCCITLTKVEALSEMIKSTLGPVMKDIT